MSRENQPPNTPEPYINNGEADNENIDSNITDKVLKYSNKTRDYYLDYLQANDYIAEDLLQNSEKKTREKIDHIPLFEALSKHKLPESDSKLTKYVHSMAGALISEAFGTRREVLEDNFNEVQENIADNIAADTEKKLELAAAKIELRARAKELEALHEELGRIMLEFEEYRKKNATDS